MKLIPRLLICLVLLTSVDLAAQNKMSERELEGLKGKVKSVLTERADARMTDRKLIETKRRKAQFIDFQPDGLMLNRNEFEYFEGDLFESNSYFYVDGDRAVKGVIGPGALTVTVDTPEDETPGDPRYEFKLNYKYDVSGRVTEEAMLDNRGELWLRYVYEYAPGERRQLVYDADGALNQKYTYKLDAKGNEIEMIAYDVETDQIGGKEKYEYLRFDRQGNWSKRVEYQADKDNNFKMIVREVKYRTITYYP